MRRLGLAGPKSRLKGGCGHDGPPSKARLNVHLRHDQVSHRALLGHEAFLRHALDIVGGNPVQLIQRCK